MFYSLLNRPSYDRLRRRGHQLTLVIFSLWLLPAWGWSADGPCTSEPYRAFDFWVGDWEVHTPDGTFAGRNRISVEEGGCLLLERWTSAQGGSGQSYNYYHPVTAKWRQVWISAGSVIDYEGGVDNGAMVLEGTISYHGNGQSAPFRGRWTPGEHGSVLQEFEQWNEAEQRWDGWFTGRYTRAPAAER